MTLVAPLGFAALAERDATVAPLARLYDAAFRAAADPVWARAIPELAHAQVARGLPLLHHATLRPDQAPLRRLADELGDLAGVDLPGGNLGWLLRSSLRQSFDDDTSPVSPLPLGHFEAGGAAASRRDAPWPVGHGQGEGDASDANFGSPAVTATLAALLALPLLQAAGRAAAPLLKGLIWDAGWCPTCAAWPTLGESRGLERERWLRCGRCGTGWRFDPARCAFCGNRDHRTLGYLAAEGQAEARRLLTCEGCGGYLKSIATIGAPAPADVVLVDLSTIELDLAAVDRGFTHPEGLGCPIEVAVEPAHAAGWSLFRR